MSEHRLLMKSDGDRLLTRDKAQPSPLTLNEARRELIELSGMNVPQLVLDASQQAQAGRLFVIETLSETLITKGGGEATRALASGALRAPFPVTFILVTFEGFSTPVLVHVLHDDVVDDEAQDYGVRVSFAQPSRLSTGEIDWEDFGNDETGSFFCDAISVILSLIADSRSTATRIVAPDKLNKARLKRGKAAIPPYWKIEPPKPTVLIPNAAPAAPTKPKGGTHASPRPHDRRGHPRHLNGDRTTWVRASRVNALVPHLTRGRSFYEVRL
jgi:hypothetical protein